MPSLEELILPAISCPIDVEKGIRGGIRLRLMKDLLEVEIRHANGDASYNSEQICSREHVFVNQAYFPFFGIVASNTDTRINDIDISAVYVKNMDDKRYTDKAALEEERLHYLLKKHEGGVVLEEESQNMGKPSAHDLLAVKLQDEVKRGQKASLTYLQPETDDIYEVLFKYMEAIKGHELGLKEFQERMSGYRTDQSFSTKILAKPRQMEILEEQFKMLAAKSDSLGSEIGRVKTMIATVTDEKHLQGVEGIKQSG